jgi:GTP cyclohydrolase I
MRDRGDEVMARQAELEAAVESLLSGIGEQPTRGGLLETPGRVAKAWLKTWASGYGQDPGAILKVFEDGAQDYDEMVLVSGINVYSHCEHHMAPIVGKACVAYVPDGRIVGLSKLARLVDVYARRLQVQERLTQQIRAALEEHLKPLGVGVMIQARHFCMESRGIQQTGTVTVTTALSGCIKDEPETRAEFLDTAKLSTAPI